MSRKAWVIKDDCTSCSLCVDTLPQYFRMDNDDLSETHNKGENVQDAVVPEADYVKMQEMMDDCPGECIKWKDE
ncbi:MAG TPA: ferredoxin [Turneriella sp.]|nr:ferredoxin [Turneriella sp.]